MKKPFEGVIGNLNRRMLQTESAWMREELGKYQTAAALRDLPRRPPQARGAGGQDRRRGHLPGDPPLGRRRARLVLRRSPTSSPRPQNEIARAILKEINERLGFLNNVGLDYLNLDRTSGTLSGGESQRIRLASQIGSGLSGVLYVLDEPCIGLHQRDNDRLLVTLKRLRDLGNTVLVVEHDEDAIRHADYVIDMGPGAGVHGGEVVARARSTRCSPARTASPPIISPAAARSRSRPSAARATARSSPSTAPPPTTSRTSPPRIPLGTFTCVTGVSRLGQVELHHRHALRRRRAPPERRPHPRRPRTRRSPGLEYLDKVIDIDQSPIGRTPRSNPATYTGAFTQIRDWFAGLPESQARGYKPGRFSFNVKGGRCEACQGDGLIKIEMHFLPDVYVTCDVCHGQRYNRETLEVKFKGHSRSPTCST